MTPMRWLAAGFCAAAAVALGVISLQRNLQRACDQHEWPDFSFCARPDPAVAEQVRDLRARIAANPGDTAPWLALTLLTAQPGGVAPLDEDAVLATAARMAPQNALRLRVQAARSMQQARWPQAVEALVRLVQEHGDPAAARVLASLVANAAAEPALRAAVHPGITWLEPVLAQLEAARVPVVLAMPLVAQALPLRLVSAGTGQALMRALKADGQWLEAQALWVYLLGGSAPLLFNGGFEQGFIADGFDWELLPQSPSKAGVLVTQPALAERGRVLQLEFTGRTLGQPIIRQVLVLPPGAYRWTGEYMARQLRTERGLALTFRCVAGGRELARSEPLGDTRGEWTRMEVALAVPADCAAVALQLQTVVDSEALGGLRGAMSFDAFHLGPRGGTP